MAYIDRVAECEINVTTHHHTMDDPLDVLYLN